MEVAPIIIAATAAAGSAVYAQKQINQQKKQVKASQEAAQKEYDLNVAQAQLTLEEQQRRNRNLLTQQQSSYKARLGASGMSSTSGTGQNTLDTMQRDHDIEDKYLTEKANISLEALVNQINADTTRNLLEQALLKDKSVQSALSSFGSAGRSLLR